MLQIQCLTRILFQISSSLLFVVHCTMLRWIACDVRSFDYYLVNSLALKNNLEIFSRFTFFLDDCMFKPLLSYLKIKITLSLFSYLKMLLCNWVLNYIVISAP